MPADVPQAAPVLVTFLTTNELKERERLMDAEAREQLRQAAFEDMRQGIDLGGPPYPKREELQLGRTVCE
jgi:hypothetical protein